ncbi:unnamed protein product [Urochloa humidicola]
MPYYLHIAMALLSLSLHIPASSATTDTISADRALSVSDKLVSRNGSNHDVYYPVHVAREILNGDVRSLLDNRLDGNVNLKEAEIACKVACWCIQDDEFDRPTMGEVVQILEGLLDINIPPMPRLLQAVAGSSHTSSNPFLARYLSI